ncbi:MAG: polyprenyl synthetase family protein [Clostridia bacterium]
MNFNEYLNLMVEKTEKALIDYLPNIATYPAVIHEAMHYSICSGGKRIRPVLLLATYESLGGKIDEVLPFACSIECVHSYSLIHDDLPAMDNDNYRRGKLTSHKVFGEANAILAGDGLLTFAFELMVKEGVSFFNDKKVLECVCILAQAAGTRGMIGGQVVDIAGENTTVDIQTLNYIHTHKTGKLLICPVKMACILGDAEPENTENLLIFASYLGLAFQMQDDILDIESTKDVLGKPIGSDKKNNKATYPAIMGMEQTKKMLNQTWQKAEQALKKCKLENDRLLELLNYIKNRMY